MNHKLSWVLFAIALSSLFAGVKPAHADETTPCPFPWLEGEYQYTSSTGENSTVFFSPVGENASQGTWTRANGDRESEIAGWQPELKQVVITGFGAAGNYWHITATNVTEKGFQGDAVFRDVDGSFWEGDFQLTVHGLDRATTRFEGKDQNGKAVKFEGGFERIDRTATREEFREFVDAMIGRWSGEITLIADWPGMSHKKGDQLMRYQTRSRIANGEGFIANAVGGATSNFNFAFYNASTQQIRIVGTDTAGGMFDSTLWKISGSEWGATASGCLADGSKVSGQISLLLSDDGDTLTFKGDLDIEGQDTLPLNDTYKRLD